MKRTLVLKREALADLTIEELTGVAAAAADGAEIRSGLSCPVRDCLGLTLPPQCYSTPWC